MKRVILLFVIFTLCFSAYGQDEDEKTTQIPEHHFKIVDGKIIWQKVFDFNNSMNIRDLFIEKNILTDVAETNQKMIGKLKPIKIDFKSSGFSRMNIPIYLTSSDLSCNVSIETKDNKYRITLEKFILIDNVSGGVLKKGNETDYELYSVKKNNEFRNSFLKYDVIIVENQLNKIFSLLVEKSDW